MSENKSKFCTECGEKIEDSKAFCGSCGTALEGEGAETPKEAVAPSPKNAPTDKNKKLMMIAGGAFVAVVLITVLAISVLGGGISGTTWYAVDETNEIWSITTLSFGRGTVTSTNADGQETVLEFDEETFNFYGSNLNLIHIRTADGSGTYTVEYITDDPVLTSWRSEALPRGLFHLYFSSKEQAQMLVDENNAAVEQERLRIEQEERERAEEERLREEEEERERAEAEAALIQTVHDMFEGRFEFDARRAPVGNQGALARGHIDNASTLAISGTEATYTWGESRWRNPSATNANRDPNEAAVIERLFDQDGTKEFALSNIVLTGERFMETEYRGMIAFAGGNEYPFELIADWNRSEVRLAIGETFWTRLQPLPPRD
jgi:hypothetical protein